MTKNQDRDRRVKSRGTGGSEDLTARTTNFDAQTLSASGKPLSEAARQAMPGLLPAAERRARFAEMQRMDHISASN